MKKIMFISFIGVSILLAFIGLNSKSNYLREDNILGIYLDNELQESIPKKGEAVFSKAVCDNNATKIYWDIDKWGLFISNLSKKTKCNLYFVNYSGQTIFDFDYTGSEQTFTAPVSGTYRLETWGAQGGNGYDGYTIGGYGGYSNGILHLNTNEILYINVGGQGFTNTSKAENSTSYGGYNGGGNSSNVFLNKLVSGGGGSTHMALVSGILSTLKDSKDKILIVSGGGGGTSYASASQISSGGAGGGYKGNSGITNRTDDWCKNNAGCVPGGGGSQESLKDNDFGAGLASGDGAGGGGGYYGGGPGGTVSGGGGSGYIGNLLLTNKAMYCYNCEESNEESTKTISTTCNEETPTSYCAKKGNGYARITLVSID